MRYIPELFIQITLQGVVGMSSNLLPPQCIFYSVLDTCRTDSITPKYIQQDTGYMNLLPDVRFTT